LPRPVGKQEAKPLPASLLSWLVSSDLTAADGHCLSWWNPEHPGYPYPEISGLLLSLLSIEDRVPDRRAELVGALVGAARVEAGVARGGRTYTFDTAMALRGLLLSADPAPRVHDLALAWTELLVRAAERQDPAVGGGWAGELRPDTHWSESFGAHQAKVCGALVVAAERFGRWPDLGEALLTYVRAGTDIQQADGRFPAHGRTGVTYVHSHCYAVEGLLMSRAGGVPVDDIDARVRAGASWLASAQVSAGGLLAWHDGTRAWGPVRADATAQALRIWTLVDPDRYAGHRSAAVGALTSLVAPGRGLRYEPESTDVNAWATIFAHQALSWQRAAAAADPAHLV
jgi:hypothetical protein